MELRERFRRVAFETILAGAARKDVVAAIAKMEAARDFVSRELAVEILEDAEKHIDFLETQIDLLAKVGLQNYLQSQTGTAP